MPIRNPGEVLHLRAGERDLRVVVHHRQRIAEGPGGLARRLSKRPQPGRVQVRVRDGVQSGRVGCGMCGEQWGERPSELHPAVAFGQGQVVHHVARCADRGETAGLLRRIGELLDHSDGQDHRVGRRLAQPIHPHHLRA